LRRKIPHATLKSINAYSAAYNVAPPTGGMPFPGNSQSLVYDADGNLTFDGIWTYAWNAENRLIEMTMTNISGVAATNRLKLDFAYDYMGRRISKIVSTNSTGNSFVRQSTNYFIYDSWNLIASFNSANVPQQSFVWGLDLSGTMTKAGGIGGLVTVLTNGSAYFACYDGNGNITGLIVASGGSVSARYEYSPFGELIRVSGLLAKGNPFRFSTKFNDGESGLVYYGFRYYSPTMGRWLGRDSIQEKGGNNLFGYCGNNSVVYIDNNGQFVIGMVVGAIAGGVTGYFGTWLGDPNATTGDAWRNAGIGAAMGAICGMLDPSEGLIASAAANGLAGAAGDLLSQMGAHPNKPIDITELTLSGIAGVVGGVIGIRTAGLNQTELRAALIGGVAGMDTSFVGSVSSEALKCAFGDALEVQLNLDQ
jgi:RHS repeat-associated protein